MTATYLLKTLICSESEDISLIQKQNRGNDAIEAKNEITQLKTGGINSNELFKKILKRRF